ncbi:hypothetical protein ATE77_13465 [Sphingopyxis sp. H005]|nr:hypothetical protein ATE70_14385 [Sphingopyxis sp. H053]KTE15397.1 hypothetical protein ATE76_05845 [Sphingopyxis sp. H093]KTE43490.1 hypothetical protein ATE77_13465 [Sphingopyxis sp. H005]
MRGRKRGKNRRQNSRQISSHIIVPDSQNAIALALQIAVALDVGFGGGVLRSVNLNDQALLLTDEIGDEGADRLLFAKFETA